MPTTSSSACPLAAAARAVCAGWLIVRRGVGFLAVLALGVLTTMHIGRGSQAPVVTPPQRITQDGDFKQHLAWSPDGRRFLFTRLHRGTMGLWLVDADGQNLRRLFAHDEGPDFDGHWSPDGRRIVFIYDQLQGTDGKLHIYTIGADGSQPTLLIPHEQLEEAPRWSPDGKHIAFVSNRDGNQEIYIAGAMARTSGD